MVSYGKTIAKLRKDRGLTQSELGKELNVTYQAVSKWENDLSQPDFDTIVAMCKLFGVTVDEFTRLASGDTVPENTADEAAPAAVGQPAPAPAYGSYGNPAPAQNTYNNYYNPAPAPQYGASTAGNGASAASGRHGPHIGYLCGLIAALAVGIASLIFYILDDEVPLGIGIFCAYLFFSYIALIGHECVVWDILIGGFTKIVDMPGVIFSLDLDGILFLLVYKFIIAPILTVIIWLLFAIGAFFLSVILAPFIFPFRIPRIIKDTF